MKLLALAVLISLCGCAAKSRELPRGMDRAVIHHAVWPDCLKKSDQVICRCSTFNIFTGADGSTVLRCAK